MLFELKINNMTNFERYRDLKTSLGFTIKSEFINWIQLYVIEKFKTNGSWGNYNKGIIHIISIDSESYPAKKDIAKLEEIILTSSKSLPEKDPYDGGCCLGISYLLNHIPVFLVNEKSFRQYSDSPENTFEYLGWYMRLGRNNDIPSIFICYDRIKIYSKNNNYKYLFAKVVIHEFAHALMDCGIISLKKLNKRNKILYEWIEESLANFITLQIAEKSNFKRFKKDVINFIKIQPDNYKFGKVLFDEYHEDLFIWMLWWKIKESAFKDFPSTNIERFKNKATFRKNLAKYSAKLKRINSL
jgi:hypothetical protein